MDTEKLRELWEAFEEIPIDDEDTIEMDFMDFPVGTYRFDIWKWFDDNCPNGLVEDLYNK